MWVGLSGINVYQAHYNACFVDMCSTGACICVNDFLVVIVRFIFCLFVVIVRVVLFVCCCLFACLLWEGVGEGGASFFLMIECHLELPFSMNEVFCYEI